MERGIYKEIEFKSGSSDEMSASLSTQSRIGMIQSDMKASDSLKKRHALIEMSVQVHLNDLISIDLQQFQMKWQESMNERARALVGHQSMQHQLKIKIQKYQNEFEKEQFKLRYMESMANQILNK